MTFALDKVRLRRVLANGDDCAFLDLPTSGSGLATEFDPRSHSSHAGMLSGAVWQAGRVGIIACSIDCRLALQVDSDSDGTYFHVRATVAFGEARHGVKQRLNLTADPEEIRRLGRAHLEPVEQVITIFQEVVDEGNDLLEQLHEAVKFFTSGPKVGLPGAHDKRT